MSNGQPIDIDRAEAQHEAYRGGLASFAAEVVTLPPDSDLPDAVFIEDAAVVLDEIAVIANRGVAPRRA